MSAGEDEHMSNKEPSVHPCSMHGEHVLNGWRTASSAGCPELWARMVDTVRTAINRATAASRRPDKEDDRG